MTTRNQGLRTTLLTGLGLLSASIMLFPVYWIFITSLKGTVEIFRTPPTFVPLHPDWSPYVDNLFKNQDILRYMGNSLQIGLGTMLLGLLLGVPAAYGLSRLNIRGKGAFLLLLLLVQMFPGIMLALPLFVMFTHLNLVNSLWGVVLATTTRTLPFVTLVIRPYFLGLPRELEDAAAIDGCTRWSAFYRIILPLSRPGLLTVAALTFLMGWSEFLYPLALINDDTKRPLTLGINKFISEYGVRWNDLMAVAVVAAIPVILVFIFAQRYITSGLAVGAVKE